MGEFADALPNRARLFRSWATYGCLKGRMAFELRNLARSIQRRAEGRAKWRNDHFQIV